MLERHREHLARLDVVTVVQTRTYFHLNRHLDLFDTLRKCGYCQADLVLCLLRLNTRNSLAVAELLVGRPITRCPSSLYFRRSPLPPAARPRRGDDRLVTRLSSERSSSCVLSAGLYDRLSVARVGMSVLQLVSRGVRRRDLLIATRRGYLQLEGAR